MTPLEAQSPGVYQITVQATDDGTPNRTTTRPFQVTVDEHNDAPTISQVLDTTATEGVELSFQIEATDPEGGTLSYVFVGNVPSGASLDASTGVFGWTPNESQGGGEFQFTVRVTDDGVRAVADRRVLDQRQ
ncbi:MAG: putative Ig domain-containing protein [Pirellulaceae bacterium]